MGSNPAAASPENSAGHWAERARKVLAGGVSTNVRLIDHPQPFVVERAEGSRVWEAGGGSYIDYVAGFGAILLGYAHPRVNDAVRAILDRGQQYGATHTTEIELAEKVCALLPNVERVRFTSSGSEAIHGALRLARAVTKRRKVIKFEGHYHGWLDTILISTNPPSPAYPEGKAVPGIPESGGIPPSVLDDLLIVPWNDAGTLAQVLEEHGSDVAAVLMEGVMGNNGAIEPQPGFLEAARELCDKHGCLFILDEVITGFRLGVQGAQGKYGVRPDLAVFGKAMGSGFPISMIGGRADLMDHYGRGTVNHSGTFNGNTLSTAAALASLAVIEEEADTLYPRLYQLGNRLIEGMKEAGQKAGLPVFAQGPGPVWWMWIFSEDLPPAVKEHGRIRYLAEAVGADKEAYEQFRTEMRRRGVRMMPAGRWYVTAAHTEGDIEQTLKAAEEALQVVASQKAGS